MASAYFPNGLSCRRRTLPGHFVDIRGGLAQIVNEHHMPYVLRMADAKVRISEDWLEQLPKWTAMLGESRPVTATITNFETPPESVSTSEEATGWDVPIGHHKGGCRCGMCERIRGQRRAKAA